MKKLFKHTASKIQLCYMFHYMYRLPLMMIQELLQSKIFINNVYLVISIVCKCSRFVILLNYDVISFLTNEIHVTPIVDLPNSNHDLTQNRTLNEASINVCQFILQ